jgi:hypothetical protein
MAGEVPEELDGPLRALEAARDEILIALERLPRRIDRFRRGMAGGERAASILEAIGQEQRRHLSESLAAMQVAIRGFRSSSMHWMVENEGLSITEVSRVMGISRQLATRLYQASDPLHHTPGRRRPTGRAPREWAAEAEPGAPYTP